MLVSVPKEEPEARAEALVTEDAETPSAVGSPEGRAIYYRSFSIAHLLLIISVSVSSGIDASAFGSSFGAIIV